MQSERIQILIQVLFKGVNIILHNIHDLSSVYFFEIFSYIYMNQIR